MALVLADEQDANSYDSAIQRLNDARLRFWARQKTINNLIEGVPFDQTMHTLEHFGDRLPAL